MDSYRRLRFVSGNGTARDTQVFAVADDGTETPIDFVITRAELTCDDGELSAWQGRIWVDIPAVARQTVIDLTEAFVDTTTYVDVQPLVAHAAEKEN